MLTQNCDKKLKLCYDRDGELEMNNFTFLMEEQIFGSSALDIIKKYGTKCAITDFSILLGGYVSQDNYTNEGNQKKNRTGWWWTKTPVDESARVVFKDGNRG